jgi:hypothetical protein
MQSLWESPWTPRDRCVIALKTPWNRNATALVSPWTPRKRCVIVVQSPWTLRKRCAIAVGHLCVPQRPHYGLTALSRRSRRLYALSRRLHGVPTAFFKGWSSHGVCNLQQNTNAVPWRSRRFYSVSWRCHGAHTAMLVFCTAIWWRSRSLWERHPSVTGVFMVIKTLNK